MAPTKKKRVAQSAKRIGAAKPKARVKIPATRRPAAKRAAKKVAAKHARPVAESIFYRLHALLHTVQTIAQFEDQLCSLTNHARSEGTLDAEAREELHKLLLDLPSSDYHAELDALHEAVHALELAPGGRQRVKA